MIISYIFSDFATEPIFATSWWMIIVANIFLGINQGLAWSMTVNMKVDLAKPTQRGLATGFNEFAGYTGIAVMAAISGYVASTFSNRPEPFYIGIIIVIIGFILSLFVKDTGAHVKQQSKHSNKDKNLSAKEIFERTVIKDKNLSSLTFSGLTTNLKDGMAWGLFPIFLLVLDYLYLKLVCWLPFIQLHGEYSNCSQDH